MTRRILVNLIFFAALGVVMTLWAISSIIKIDAIEQPFRVTADFTASPGLRHDLEVSYLGVRVGKVGNVRLETGKVAVELEMYKGAKVPDNAGAQVLRKSAIGEPYIDLSAPQGPAGRPMRGGDHIPLSRTSVTVEYKRLFDRAAVMLKAINPQDAQTVVHELATGLEGRGQAIRDTVNDAHQLTGTLAANAPLLDQTATELTRATGILAAHRGELASGVNNLAAFTASLRQSRESLVRILDNGPGFAARLDRLLEASRPGFNCLTTALGTPAPSIFNPQAVGQVNHALRLFPLFEKQVHDVTAFQPNGTAYIKSKILLTLAGPEAPAEYAKPTPKPVPPPLSKCPVPRTSAAAARTTVAATPVEAKPEPTTEQINSTPVSTTTSTARMLSLVPVTLAGVVLLAALVNVLIAVRRRPRKSD